MTYAVHLVGDGDATCNALHSSMKKKASGRQPIGPVSGWRF